MSVGSSEACFSHHGSVSVMSHLNSHYLGAEEGIGCCGALADGSAVYRPQESSEDLSCCSPLNLAGPRPRDSTSPPPSAQRPLALQFTDLAAGGYASCPSGPGQLQASHHHQLDQRHHQLDQQHHQRDGRHRQRGRQHRYHHQQQQPVSRAERPSPDADWQLPPCATIRLTRYPAPAHPFHVPLAPAPISAPPPQQPAPTLHHPDQQQQQQLATTATSLASWPFRCSTCGRGSSSKEALRTHIEEHSVGKLCICDICGIRLSKKSSLRRHRMTHMDTKEFSCDVCRRSFYQRHDMLRHKAQHSKATLHCAGCNRQFSAQHHLAAHKCCGTARPGGGGRRQGGGDQLACRLCSQTCSTPAAWGFHMWRHTKDAKYLPDFTGGATTPTGPLEPPAGPPEPPTGPPEPPAGPPEPPTGPPEPPAGPPEPPAGPPEPPAGPPEPPGGPREPPAGLNTEADTEPGRRCSGGVHE